MENKFARLLLIFYLIFYYHENIRINWYAVLPGFKFEVIGNRIYV